MKIPNLQSWFRLPAVLGLSLESGRLAVAWVRRENGTSRVQHAFVLPVSADAVLADPAQAGRQLAERLNQAGITTRDCVVCLPPGWALTAPVELPAISPEDFRGYLELRAEREFPLPPTELSLAHSTYQLVAGHPRATLAAVPSRRLEAVRRMLTTAGRQPVSISLGLDRCLGPDATPGTLNFLANGSHVDLVICAGGGVVAIRSLEGSPGGSALEPAFDPHRFFREVRITLGRLPEELRQQIRTGRFLGTDISARRLHEAMESPLRGLGIESRLGDALLRAAAPGDRTLETEAEIAMEAARRHLQGARTIFEFVPPKVSRWQAATQRLSTGRNRWGFLAGVGALTLVLGLLSWRAQQESRLERAWANLRPRVTAAENLQRKIRQFRPWIDNTPRSVAVLEAVTRAFPEEGSVWAQSVEVRQGVVTCTGFARSQSALTETLDRLRTNPEVRQIKVHQLRGQNPLQFSFQFAWGHEAED